ncbi:heme-binding domain-containing protein [Pedobacter cryophilus]|uniref:Cytochrome C n=1 Tax=Pedobacter cryophilus TaxID=2571271 RepID=A0A4U1C155_9SPHI|nr:heme-binding domain-containing protein [Pedobacter cryophilus]TKB97820.1 cytochrome C [Pedobacter cryophilus]
MIKKILLALGVVIIVIQFIRPEKNIAAGAQPNAISTKYTVPDTVNQLLSVACKDCHSNNTVYPWYSNIQPVAWWLNDHVKEGKRKFNLDEFTTYTLKRQDHKLEELIESQEDHWMPLDSYTWVHRDAALTDAQRKVLIDWANVTRKQIQSNPDFATSPKK